MEDCVFPNAWNISTIKPELHIFGGHWNDEVHPVIKHSVSPTNMISVLSSIQLLTSSTALIIFLAHGFLSSSRHKKLGRMKDEILKHSSEKAMNTIVIMLNWEGGADIGFENYSQAAANMQSVGLWLAPYLSAVKNTTISFGTEKRNERGQTFVWGIGHSLGAHLLGLASRHSDHNFNRITALDPAGPCFENHHQDIRIRKSDAKIVDVIHTDGYTTPTLSRLIPLIHAGTLVPLGTVDFYPNYGFDQPAEDFEIGKSHSQTIDYFTWSISNPNKFLTFQVFDEPPEFEKPSYKLKFNPFGAEMGFHYRGSPKGNFYIQTNSTEPWK